MPRPQKRKMEREEPRVEMPITVVTAMRSLRAPRVMAPRTEKVLRRARRRVPVIGGRGWVLERERM